VREFVKWLLPESNELGRELSHVKNLYERGQKGKASKFYEDAEKRCHLKKAQICNYIQLHQNWVRVWEYIESGEAPFITTMSDAMDFIRGSGIFAPTPLASAADLTIAEASEESEDEAAIEEEEPSPSKPKQKRMVCKKTEILHEAAKQLDTLANMKTLDEDTRANAEQISMDLTDLCDELESVYGQYVEIEETDVPVITPVSQSDEWVHPQNPQVEPEQVTPKGTKPVKIGIRYPLTPEGIAEFQADYSNAGGSDLAFSKITPWGRDGIAKHRKAIEVMVS
jgi:hypothetical protein